MDFHHMYLKYAEKMIKNFYAGKEGLTRQFEIGPDVSLDNIEAAAIC